MASTAEETQVRVRFVTSLPGRFRVPGSQSSSFAVPASLGRYGLSEVVNAMLGNVDVGTVHPFDFVVEGHLLRSSLKECLLQRGISAETVITVEYFLAAAPPELSASAGHDDWVSAVRCAAARGIVVSGSYDGGIRFFSTAGYTQSASGDHVDLASAVEEGLNGSHPPPLVPASSAHAPATSAPGSPAVALQSPPQLLLGGHKGPITALAMSHPPGQLQDPSLSFAVLSASKDHSLRLTQVAWDKGGQLACSPPVSILRGHKSAVLTADISRSSRQACSGSWDGELWVWHLEATAGAEGTGGDGDGGDNKTSSAIKQGTEKRRKLEQGNGAVFAEPAVREFGGSHSTLQGHSGAVSCAQFVERSSTGAAEEEGEAALFPVLSDTLLSGSWDHSIRAWDVEHEACIHTRTTEHPVLSISAFGGPEQSLFASGGASKALLLWDSRARGTTKPALKLMSHKAWISVVSWCRQSHSAHLLLSGSYDGTVKVWDTRTTIPLHTVAAHPNSKVLCADWWNPSCFLSGGADNKLQAFQGKHAWA